MTSARDLNNLPRLVHHAARGSSQEAAQTRTSGGPNDAATYTVVTDVDAASLPAVRALLRLDFPLAFVEDDPRSSLGARRPHRRRITQNLAPALRQLLLRARLEHRSAALASLGHLGERA